MSAGPVRQPVAWRPHPADVEKLTARGEHCEHRGCRNPGAIVTWRWFRSAWARRVLLAEHVLCEQHGQEFAARHHIEIEPPPAVRSVRRDTPREEDR